MTAHTLRFAAALAASALAAGAVAQPNEVPRGAYVCTVEQTAGIGAEMMEGPIRPRRLLRTML